MKKVIFILLILLISISQIACASSKDSFIETTEENYELKESDQYEKAYNSIDDKTREKYKDALESIEKKIELSEGEELANGYQEKAMILDGLKRHEEAVDFYIKALKINPSESIADNLLRSKNLFNISFKYTAKGIDEIKDINEKRALGAVEKYLESCKNYDIDGMIGLLDVPDEEIKERREYFIKYEMGNSADLKYEIKYIKVMSDTEVKFLVTLTEPWSKTNSIMSLRKVDDKWKIYKQIVTSSEPIES